MSCCDVSGLLPVTDALALMESSITPINQFVTLPVTQALGCVLAQDVVSSINVPPDDNSAMDGYAINATACLPSHEFTNVGRVLAGQTFNEALMPGQCVRIMTGAAIPDGTTCVVMQEHAKSQQNKVRFNAELTFGSHIRRKGEDVTQGNIVLSKGTKLAPAQLGVLASIGVGKVNAFRAIKVGIFSTGDELQVADNALTPGHIYESNRIVCASKLAQLNCSVIDFGIIKDCPRAIKSAFEQAAQQCDVIITSGGVSVGEADFVKDVLLEDGEINFWKLAIKPGKPFAYGKYKQAIFFGLPGNPVATFVTFDVLVTPMLKRLAGDQSHAPLLLDAINVKAIKRRPGRTEYQRAFLSTNEQGQLTAKTTGHQGSHIMTSLTQANAYIVLSDVQGNIDEGEMLKVMPFSSLS